MKDEEIIEVLRAKMAGKTIQCASKGHSNWGDIIGQPIWNFEKLDYRVKPESQYRPYVDSKEFIEAQKEHGPYLKSTGANAYYFPRCIESDGISIQGRNTAFNYGYLKVLEFFVWQDGTKCGVEEK